jgi:hypothetical protein
MDQRDYSRSVFSIAHSRAVFSAEKLTHAAVFGGFTGVNLMGLKGLLWSEQGVLARIPSQTTRMGGRGVEVGLRGW